MPEQWLGDEVQRTMWDQHRQKLAPVVVWGAVRALAGGEPSRILVDVLLLQNRTEWRAAWVTSSAMGLVTASKNIEGWSAYSEHADPDELVSWARPLSEVSVLSLGTVDCKHARSDWEQDDGWRWSSTAVVGFRDGTQVSLPPGGEVLNDEHDAEIQTFLNAVTSR